LQASESEEAPRSETNAPQKLSAARELGEIDSRPDSSGQHESNYEPAIDALCGLVCDEKDREELRSCLVFMCTRSAFTLAFQSSLVTMTNLRRGDVERMDDHELLTFVYSFVDQFKKYMVDPLSQVATVGTEDGSSYYQYYYTDATSSTELMFRDLDDEEVLEEAAAERAQLYQMDDEEVQTEVGMNWAGAASSPSDQDPEELLRQILGEEGMQDMQELADDYERNGDALPLLVPPIRRTGTMREEAARLEEGCLAAGAAGITEETKEATDSTDFLSKGLPRRPTTSSAITGRRSLTPRQLVKDAQTETSVRLPYELSAVQVCEHDEDVALESPFLVHLRHTLPPDHPLMKMNVNDYRELQDVIDDYSVEIQTNVTLVREFDVNRFAVGTNVIVEKPGTEVGYCQYDVLDAAEEKSVMTDTEMRLTGGIVEALSTQARQSTDGQRATRGSVWAKPPPFVPGDRQVISPLQDEETKSTVIQRFLGAREALVEFALRNKAGTEAGKGSAEDQSTSDQLRTTAGNGEDLTLTDLTEVEQLLGISLGASGIASGIGQDQGWGQSEPVAPRGTDQGVQAAELPPSEAIQKEGARSAVLAKFVGALNTQAGGAVVGVTDPIQGVPLFYSGDSHPPASSEALGSLLSDAESLNTLNGVASRAAQDASFSAVACLMDGKPQASEERSLAYFDDFREEMRKTATKEAEALQRTYQITLGPESTASSLPERAKAKSPGPPGAQSPRRGFLSSTRISAYNQASSYRMPSSILGTTRLDASNALSAARHASEPELQVTGSVGGSMVPLAAEDKQVAADSQGLPVPQASVRASTLDKDVLQRLRASSPPQMALQTRLEDRETHARAAAIIRVKSVPARMGVNVIPPVSIITHPRFGPPAISPDRLRPGDPVPVFAFGPRAHVDLVIQKYRPRRPRGQGKSNELLFSPCLVHSSVRFPVDLQGSCSAQTATAAIFNRELTGEERSSNGRAIAEPGLLPRVGETVGYIRVSSWAVQRNVASSERDGAPTQPLLPPVLEQLWSLLGTEPSILCVPTTKEYYVRAPQSCCLRSLAWLLRLIRQIVQARLSTEEATVVRLRDPSQPHLLPDTTRYTISRAPLRRGEAESAWRFTLWWAQNRYGIRRLVAQLMWTLIAGLCYYQYESDEVFLFARMFFDDLGPDFWLSYLDIRRMLSKTLGDNGTSASRTLPKEETIPLDLVPNVIHSLFGNWEEARKVALCESLYSAAREHATAGNRARNNVAASSVVSGQNALPDSIPVCTLCSVSFRAYATFRRTVFQGLQVVFLSTCRCATEAEPMDCGPVNIGDTRWMAKHRLLSEAMFQELCRRVVPVWGSDTVGEMFYAFSAPVSRISELCSSPGGSKRRQDPAPSEEASTATGEDEQQGEASVDTETSGLSDLWSQEALQEALGQDVALEPRAMSVPLFTDLFVSCCLGRFAAVSSSALDASAPTDLKRQVFLASVVHHRLSRMSERIAHLVALQDVSSRARRGAARDPGTGLSLPAPIERCKRCRTQLGVAAADLLAYDPSSALSAMRSALGMLVDAVAESKPEVASLAIGGALMAVSSYLDAGDDASKGKSGCKETAMSPPVLAG